MSGVSGPSLGGINACGMLQILPYIFNVSFFFLPIKQEVVLNIGHVGVKLEENSKKVAYKILKRHIYGLVNRRLLQSVTTFYFSF